MQPPCPVFDFHVHLYPDHLAGKAVGHLAQRFGNPPAFDGTVNGLKAHLSEAGIWGVKLHPEYQVFTLDDPRVTPVWEACSALGLFVFLHAGGERVFTPPYHSTPTALAALLTRFPQLTVIGAFLKLPFSADEQKKILWDNAARLLALQPTTRTGEPACSPQTQKGQTHRSAPTLL